MPGNDPLLEGKRFLVSGGGRGLGGEICRMLGEAGAHVIVADLDLSRATACAASLEEAGAKAQAVGVDVSDPAAVDRLFNEIAAPAASLPGASTASSTTRPSTSPCRLKKWTRSNGAVCCW